jgi:cell division protein FtsQ
MTKVDPRVAKRRAQVQAQARQRRRKRSLVAGAVVLVIAGIIGLLRSPLLDVDRVEVQGAEHTSAATVRTMTGLTGSGHPMIAVDRFALAQRIARLPWVDRAEVTRKWPNVVRVIVVERVPVGVIGVPGGVAVLDAKGRVLATAPAPPEHTYAITVAPGDKIPGPGKTVTPAVLGAVRILGALSKGLASQVESIHRLPGARPTYELTLHGPVTIRMGEDTRVADKLAAAEAVLAAQHAPGTVIDVRVPRSPAVTHGQNAPSTTSTTRKP